MPHLIVIFPYYGSVINIGHNMSPKIHSNYIICDTEWLNKKNVMV